MPEAQPRGIPLSGAPEDGDGEDGERLTGPERRCIVTGRVLPKTSLLRFVVSPDGEVVADLAERLPGRGIWLSADRDVVNTAVAKRLFSKAARRAVAVPPDLTERLESLLADRSMTLLGLARRSGRAVAGYEKVRAEIQAGRAKVVIEAADAGADGVSKIRALAFGVASGGGERPDFVGCFESGRLGAVFGRDAVVHAALAPGALAAGFVREALRYAGVAGRPLFKSIEGASGAAD